MEKWRELREKHFMCRVAQKSLDTRCLTTERLDMYYSFFFFFLLFFTFSSTSGTTINSCEVGRRKAL
jgi:hypothetical protein